MAAKSIIVYIKIFLIFSLNWSFVQLKSNLKQLYHFKSLSLNQYSRHFASSLPLRTSSSSFSPGVASLGGVTPEDSTHLAKAKRTELGAKSSSKVVEIKERNRRRNVAR